MINQIQKRPFVRILFVWILGILLQTFLELYLVSFVLLLFPFVILLLSCFSSDKAKKSMYGMRWLTGLLLLCILLFLSIQMTAVRSSDVSTIQIASLENIRQYLLQSFDYLQISEEEKSVLATITIGYRESLPYHIRQQFVMVGMAHLLAVSGFHVGVVGMMCSGLLSIFSNHIAGRWFKYLFLLFVIWVYVCVTGLASSAVRAGIMLSIYFTGKQLNRRVDGYNTLAASAFLMLVYNPLYLFDIGFQLSYLAVFSILYFQPLFVDLIKVRNPILAIPWGWITVSISAQLGVTMLCLYYFGQFSVLFLLVSLPLTLLSTILIPISLLWMFFSSFVCDIEWLRLCVEWLTHSMVDLVQQFSRIPGAIVSFHFDFVNLCFGYLSLILAMWYGKSKQPKVLLISLSLLLFILIRLCLNKM